MVTLHTARDTKDIHDHKISKYTLRIIVRQQDLIENIRVIEIIKSRLNIKVRLQLMKLTSKTDF